MWGKNQENQKPLSKNIKKEDGDNTTNELTNSNNLNDLIESYDINKINEEDYDKLRYLNDLNKEIEQEKDEKELVSEEHNKDNQENKNNDIKINKGANNGINQRLKNHTIKEVDSDNEDEYLSEFREIELMRIEIEKSLKLNLFKAAYNLIYNENNRKENILDKDKVEEKIKNDFKNKGFNNQEIDETIQKIPKILDIILKERTIEK